MATAKKSSGKKSAKGRSDKAPEDLIDEAKREMMKEAEAVRAHFDEATNQYMKALKEVMGESRKVAKIGSDLYDYLYDRAYAEDGNTWEQAVRMYGEDAAQRMRDRGQIPSADEVTDSYEPLNSIGVLNGEVLEFSGLGPAIAGVRKELARICSEIREIPIP